MFQAYDRGDITGLIAPILAPNYLVGLAGERNSEIGVTQWNLIRGKDGDCFAIIN